MRDEPIRLAILKETGIALTGCMHNYKATGILPVTHPMCVYGCGTPLYLIDGSQRLLVRPPRGSPPAALPAVLDEHA